MEQAGVAKRWWANPDAARDALAKVDSSSAQMGVGVALLGLHALGYGTLNDLARQTAVSTDRVRSALSGTDVVDVAKAAGAALSDYYGPATPRYVSARVAGWKNDADDAAMDMVTTLVHKGVPWPMALERAANGYGLPRGPALAYVAKVSDRVVPPIVVADEADRALQKWAALVAEVEETGAPDTIDKAAAVETFDYDDGPQQRVVNRDSDGKFAAASSPSGMTPDEERRARRRRRTRRAVRGRARTNAVAAARAETAQTTQTDDDEKESLGQVLARMFGDKGTRETTRERSRPRARTRERSRTNARTRDRSRASSDATFSPREKADEAMIFAEREVYGDEVQLDTSSPYLASLPKSEDRFDSWLANAPYKQSSHRYGVITVDEAAYHELVNSGGVATWSDLVQRGGATLTSISEEGKATSAADLTLFELGTEEVKRVIQVPKGKVAILIPPGEAEIYEHVADARHKHQEDVIAPDALIEVADEMRTGQTVEGFSLALKDQMGLPNLHEGGKAGSAQLNDQGGPGEAPDPALMRAMRRRDEWNSYGGEQVFGYSFDFDSVQVVDFSKTYQFQESNHRRDDEGKFTDKPSLPSGRPPVEERLARKRRRLRRAQRGRARSAIVAQTRAAQASEATDASSAQDEPLNLGMLLGPRPTAERSRERTRRTVQTRSRPRTRQIIRERATNAQNNPVADDRLPEIDFSDETFDYTDAVDAQERVHGFTSGRQPMVTDGDTRVLDLGHGVVGDGPDVDNPLLGGSMSLETAATQARLAAEDQANAMERTITAETHAFVRDGVSGGKVNRDGSITLPFTAKTRQRADHIRREIDEIAMAADPATFAEAEEFHTQPGYGDSRQTFRASKIRPGEPGNVVIDLVVPKPRQAIFYTPATDRVKIYDELDRIRDGAPETGYATSTYYRLDAEKASKMGLPDPIVAEIAHTGTSIDFFLQTFHEGEAP